MLDGRSHHLGDGVIVFGYILMKTSTDQEAQLMLTNPWDAFRG